MHYQTLLSWFFRFAAKQMQTTWKLGWNMRNPFLIQVDRPEATYNVHMGLTAIVNNEKARVRLGPEYCAQPPDRIDQMVGG